MRGNKKRRRVDLSVELSSTRRIGWLFLQCDASRHLSALRLRGMLGRREDYLRRQDRTVFVPNWFRRIRLQNCTTKSISSVLGRRRLRSRKGDSSGMTTDSQRFQSLSSSSLYLLQGNASVQTRPADPTKFTGPGVVRMKDNGDQISFTVTVPSLSIKYELLIRHEVKEPI